MIDSDTFKDFQWHRDKYDFFLHVKCLRQAALAFNLDMQLDINTLQVSIKNNDAASWLYPKYFFQDRDGGHFSSKLHDNTAWFAGWSSEKKALMIELFSNKLQFKDLLTQANIPTPAYFATNNHHLSNYIIKKSLSSNGHGIEGPYNAASGVKHQVADSEFFFESFIQGEMIKIWFCDELPICLERQNMPEVIGDGTATLSQLIKCNYIGTLTPPVMQRINQILLKNNNKPDRVLEQGEHQLLEFVWARGINRFLPVTLVNFDDLEDEYLETQLLQVGDFVGKLLQQKGHHDRVYTVDGIYEGNILWILEANSNPAIHPLLYSAILGNLKHF